MKCSGFLALGLLALFPVVRAGDDSLYPDLQDRVVSPGKSTYFVDPQAGDDANAGTSETSPWKTFLPVGRITLSPGDRLEVRPGSFTHSLSLSAQGSREKPVEVHFAPGRYEMDPVHARRETYAISNTNDDPDGLKAVGIHLIHSTHVRLSGSGPVFEARGKLMHVCIDQCSGVEIDGLAFDYKRPTVSEFTVTAAGDGFADLQVHADSAYEIVDGAVVWQGEGWTETGGLGQELDPATGRVHRMRDPLAGLKARAEEPGRIRVEGKHRFKPGRIYQIRNPFRDYCGVFTRNSRDIVWKDVHFRFIHGMGIVNQFSENLTFDRVRIAPDPASGRTTAAWADCIQASGCRGRIVVNDCVFSGAHDDAINIHGTYLRVMAWKPEQRELLVRFMQKQSYGFPAFHAGDEVSFVRWDSLASYGENRVAKAEMIDPWNMRLELEKPLPDTIRENDVLENVTWTPEVRIRGCQVRHISTRGFLCSTRRQVVIEDNDFFATHMPAVLIGVDAGSWFESGSVMDMTIRGNRFHQCGEPVIEIVPANTVPNPQVHRNIRIVGNTFELKGRLAVGGHGMDGLLVSGNTLRADPLPEAESWFEFKDCGRIDVRDNQLGEP